MSGTQSTIGIGTQVQRGDGLSPEGFNAIGEILDIGGPALSLDTPDATNMGSTNFREEVIAGIVKTGTVDFDVQYVRGNVQHVGLTNDLKTRILRNFKIVFPDDPTNPVTFAAFVTKAQPKTPVTGKRTMSFSLKLSGDFTGL
jgi:hypothetical protein